MKKCLHFIVLSCFVVAVAVGCGGPSKKARNDMKEMGTKMDEKTMKSKMKEMGGGKFSEKDMKEGPK